MHSTVGEQELAYFRECSADGRVLHAVLVLLLIVGKRTVREKPRARLHRNLPYGHEVCSSHGQEPADADARQAHLPTYPRSRPHSSTHARPLRPARAVRPQRCENALGSAGGSNWSTQSTSGRSSPRAATSVASSMCGACGEAGAAAKAASVRVRTAGWRWPWSECNVAEGRRSGKI